MDGDERKKKGRGGAEMRANVWRDLCSSTATGGCTWGKSILSLQRKKFMKLEHKCSHVQLAALNLRGEAGEEVGGNEVIKTSAETNKACNWSMIPARRNSHSSLGRVPLCCCWSAQPFTGCPQPITSYSRIYLKITSRHIFGNIKICLIPFVWYYTLRNKS